MSPESQKEEHGMYGIRARTVCAGLVLAAAVTGRAEDAVKPGELIAEPATLICLGFEWRISGDHNRNASVSVKYRRKDTQVWRESLPLYRVGKGRRLEGRKLSDGTRHGGWPVPEAFVGSALDLEPGSEYAVRLEMTDPDGVQGPAVRELTCSTRAVPKPTLGGRMRHVYPPDWQGGKKKPAFRTIMGAVNGYDPWCDNYNVSYDHACPGDTILVHGGTHRGDRFNYRDPTPFWMFGTQVLSFGGEEVKPIAIVAAGDGEAIIDGGNPKGDAPAFCLLNVMAADHLYFEGLTFRNAFIAIRAGLWRVGGCRGLTVRNCIFENVGNGILGLDGRCRDFTILDNVFIGTNDGDQFHREAGAAWGRSRAGYAVNVLGSGHAIGFNRADRFWDAINVNTSAHPDPQFHLQAYAIDIYNNDLFNICDNFIESDGGLYNIRVLRNRCFNSLGAPLSVQPVFAGPVYFIRNIVYNALRGHTALKATHGDNVIFLHNTLTCHWTMALSLDYVNVRNNLFMGPGEPLTPRDAKLPVLNIRFEDANSLLDYNGYRVGKSVAKPFVVTRRRGKLACASLKELVGKTGLETHGLAIADYGVFVRADEPDHAQDKTKLYLPETVDLRPAPGSAIVDAGCRIPGVNDDFAGKAPDIGAFEAGRRTLHYGPRGLKLPERFRDRLAPAAKITTPAAGRGGSGAERGKGRPIGAVDVRPGTGALLSLSVGAWTIKADQLAVGKTRSPQMGDMSKVDDFDLAGGVMSPTSGEWAFDVVDFAGGPWKDTNGPKCDFFLFEVGGNDVVQVSAILEDGTVGRAITVARGDWKTTSVPSRVASGNVAGVALEVSDLLDGAGKPLSRSAAIRGLRIVGEANGIDPVSILAARPR